MIEGLDTLVTLESLFLGKNKIEKLQVLDGLLTLVKVIRCRLSLGSRKADKPQSDECSSELLKKYQI